MQEKMTAEEAMSIATNFTIGGATAIKNLFNLGFVLVPTDETQWERGIDAAAQHYWFAGDEGRSQLRLVISAFMKAVGEK